MPLPTCIIAAPTSGGLQLASLITPALGFIGVIVTLAWNARQARTVQKQQERQESSALRAAILAQLKNMRRVIAEEIMFLEDPLNYFSWVPLLDFFSAYLENLSKIGTLTSSEAQLLADAYFTYQERAGYIARYGGASASSAPTGRNVSFDFRAGKDKEQVLKDLRRVLPPVEDAIIEMEKVRFVKHQV